jgi:isopropylmalate/homocitrate/citramalate synthase
MMYVKRNLAKELEEMEIVNIEAGGFLTTDSVFAAIDAIRQHDKVNHLADQVKQIEAIKRQTLKNITQLNSAI